MVWYLRSRKNSIKPAARQSWLIPVRLYNQPMKRMKRYFAAPILLFFSGVALLIFSSWPLPQRIVTLTFPPAYSLDHPELDPAALEGEITVSIPVKMRTGQTSTVNFSFQANETAIAPPATGQNEPSYLLEARLEVPGMQVKPGDSILQPVNSRTDLVFSWEIQADSKGFHSGTFWTYLLVPVSGELEMDRRPVQALPFEIEVVAVPIFFPVLIRVVAIACILAAGIILVRGKYLKC